MSQGRTALDIAPRCNVEIASYLTWWEAISNVPPPEHDERGYSTRYGPLSILKR